MTLQIITGY